MLNPNFAIPQRFIKDDLKTLLQQYRYSLDKGDVVAGTVFSTERHGYLINIGSSSSAYLPKIEKINLDNTEKTKLVNETREFLIISKEEKKRIILSIKKLNYIKAWERIQQLYSEDITIYGTFIRKNKGGILVDVEGITGFVPNSHNLNPFETNQKTEKFNNLPLKFLEINENDNYIILSYKRVILQSYRDKFNVGQVIKGTVQNIKDYGVFVDIGDAAGLIHISEITNYNIKIKNLDDFFKIGDKVTVSIIHLDTKQGRISLSTKFLD
uniref:ribosomal protein S1 n=1 Tax=Pseudoerythrocladia kornmannii TaxID=753682 RepID=UPI001BEFD1E3|nr:ribosomal protein S1 [Pseudoerythrocladia kornmannii]QUE28212.1 ribosomal protein S1 [Pseudoerythrocladia kornmannii]UNJ16717.1 ribosomal protein S1 [Pseudoerythrocladia kornmannii]